MSSRPSIASAKLTEQPGSGSRHATSTEKEGPEAPQEEILACRPTSPANDDERDRSLRFVGTELQRESQLDMVRCTETESDGDVIQEQAYLQLACCNEIGPVLETADSDDISQDRILPTNQSILTSRQTKGTRTDTPLAEGLRCCNDHAPFSHGSLPWVEPAPPGFAEESGPRPEAPHLLDWRPEFSSFGELPSYTERSREPTFLGLKGQHTIRPLHPYINFHLSHEKLACKVRGYEDRVWAKRLLLAKRKWQQQAARKAQTDTSGMGDVPMVGLEMEEDEVLDLEISDQDKTDIRELQSAELQQPDRGILENLRDTQCKTNVLDENDSMKDEFAQWQWNLNLHQQEDGKYGFRQTIWCKWQSKDEANGHSLGEAKGDAASELFYTCPHHTLELWKPRFEQKGGHHSRVRYGYYEPIGYDLPAYQEEVESSEDQQYAGISKPMLIVDQLLVSRDDNWGVDEEGDSFEIENENFCLDDLTHPESIGNINSFPWHTEYDNWTNFVDREESTFGFHQHMCDHCKSCASLHFKRVYADKEKLNYYVEAEVTVDKELGSGMNLGDEEWIAAVTGQSRRRWEARLDLEQE